MMKGCRRCRSGLTNKKHAIPPAELKHTAPIVRRTRKEAALWAGMLIAWCGMLHKANTTTGFQNPIDPAACNLVSDITVNADNADKHSMRIYV